MKKGIWKIRMPFFYTLESDIGLSDLLWYSRYQFQEDEKCIWKMRGFPGYQAGWCEADK